MPRASSSRGDLYQMALLWPVPGERPGPAGGTTFSCHPQVEGPGAGVKASGFLCDFMEAKSSPKWSLFAGQAGTQTRWIRELWTQLRGFSCGRFCLCSLLLQHTHQQELLRFSGPAQGCGVLCTVSPSGAPPPLGGFEEQLCGS